MDNSNQIFFKARQTILEMFRDRGYQGPFEKANAVTASQFYSYNLSKQDKPTPNYFKDDNDQIVMVDLWGFVETRTIPDPDDPDKLIEVEVPVYVHFTNKPKPKKTGGLKRKELYENIMKDAEIYSVITNHFEKYPEKLDPNRNKNVPWIHKVMDEEVFSGVHMIIVYDGWTYAQNKSPKDLFFTYSNREASLPLYDLEVWPAHSLIFNITKHQLVPKHRLLTNEEKFSWLKQQADYYLNTQEKEKLKSITGDLQKYRYLENYFFQLSPKISLHDPINLYYHGRLRQVYEIVREGVSPTYRMVKKSPLQQDQRK